MGAGLFHRINDDDLQILQFRGSTGAYLEPPIGMASFDVLNMARQGLMLPLRDAISTAKQDNKTARRKNVRIEQQGWTRMLNLQVIPLKNLKERCFLILFENADKAERAAPETPERRRASALGLSDDAAESEGLRPPARQESGASSGEARRIAELETELAETRDYLQSIQEQQEAANEELQAANEEVQAANEELQSINEELETSKEELESSNEELTTVNEEAVHRNAELNLLNSDLINLQTATQLAILLLGHDLTIRRFSAQAERQFHLLATDLGRHIGNVRHNLVFPVGQAASLPVPQEREAEWEREAEREGEVAAEPGTSPKQGAPEKHGSAGASPSRTPESTPDLESFVAEVIDTVRERECEVRDKDGRWFSLRVRPYFTLDNKVDGVVLVLVDIDVLKRTELTIIAARDLAESTIETVREPLIVLDGQLRVESANRVFYRNFQVAPAQTIGKSIFNLGNCQWNIPQLRTLLQDILPDNTTLEDFLVEHNFEQLGQRTMLLNARRIHDPARQTQRILLAIEDITERRKDQQEVQNARD